jgi:hypothetical protein
VIKNASLNSKPNTVKIENSPKNTSNEWVIRRYPMPKKLQRQIEKKLDQLHKLLDNLEEAHNLDANDPDT